MNAILEFLNMSPEYAITALVISFLFGLAGVFWPHPPYSKNNAELLSRSEPFDWDFMFDPPSGHDEECTCQRCHDWHVTEGDPMESKQFCRACEDHIETEVEEGRFCLSHGSASMENKKCLECEVQVRGAA